MSTDKDKGKGKKKSPVLNVVFGENDPDTMKDALRQLRRLALLIRCLWENTEELAEMHKLCAQLKKSRYDALLAEGFTEKEALEIMKDGSVI